MIVSPLGELQARVLGHEPHLTFGAQAPVFQKYRFPLSTTSP